MFLGGGMKPFLRCSTLQQQPAEITMASWAGTWIASLFAFATCCVSVCAPQTPRVAHTVCALSCNARKDFGISFPFCILPVFENVDTFPLS